MIAEFLLLAASSPAVTNSTYTGATSKGIDDAAMPHRRQVDYVRVWQVPRRTGR